MAKPNHLLKRGSQYYVRVRIPTALQEHYAPAKEIVRSLRTSDYADACLKVRSAALKIFTQFETQKKAQKSKLTGITPDETKQITDLWFAHLLEEDEEERLEGLSDHQFDKKVETNEVVSELLKKQLARGHWQDESHLFEVDDFLESHGYFIDKNSAEYKTVAVEFLKAFSKASAVVSQRNKGEIVDTPKVAPLKPSGTPSGIPLLSL